MSDDPNAHEEGFYWVVLGSLHLLAKQGQLVYDFTTDQYRYRKVMPVALSASLLGPENPELSQGRKAFIEHQVSIVSEQRVGEGRGSIGAQPQLRRDRRQSASCTSPEAHPPPRSHPPNG